MAKRNQVTTDLRISADAQLKNSRSFMNQLDKLIDKFDFGDKINNQLSSAKSQLKEYNKILEKVQSKTLISDEETKDLIKASKEIANIVTKTEKLYSNLSTSELQKFSKAYINQVKAQEEAVAKIKNEYATKTGKNFDKELANYEKLSGKVKALEKERNNLAKNGATQIVTKEIEQLNQKLDEQKNKLLEIRKIQQASASAYTSAANAESRKRGYNSYNDIKGIKTQNETQIRKQLGNAEYKQQANLISEINREIKSIEKNKQDNNNLDEAAIALAKQYKIANISTLDSLKQEMKLRREKLNLFKNNKSELADEKLVTTELNKQNKILEDRKAIESAGKAAELKVIQQSGYSSKASLSASASATNRSVTNVEGQLSEAGIESIANNAAQLVASQIAKLNSEIAKGNQDLSAIDETNKKLATQSERTADESDIKEMTRKVNSDVSSVQTNVNDHTSKDNSRIATEIAQEFNRSKIEEYKDKINSGLENLTKEDFNDDDVVRANQQLLSNSVKTIFSQMDDLASGKNNFEELSKNLEATIKLTNEMTDAFREELTARIKISEDEIAAYQKQKDRGITGAAGKYIDEQIKGQQENIRFDKATLSPAIEASDNLGSMLEHFLVNLQSKNDTLKTYSKDATILSNNLRKAAEQSQYLGSTFDDLKNKIGYFLSLNYVFDQMTRKITEAVQTTKEMDKDMTQIGLVLGKTSSQVWQNFDTYAQMADRLNTTTSQVTESMKLFYQQGLNTTEVNKMVEASAIAAALGESTMAEASETLTSIINSYNLSANEAMMVTDKISQIAIVSAADFGELSTAIEKVASSAASAGLDLDHMMGYLAKMIETTREAPTNIGTALKTIVANFTQFKEDPSQIDVEGSDINKVDKALKSVDVSLTNTSGDVRDLSEVLDDLGAKWSTLTRNQKSYLATAIAGTRQQSRFYAMMNDYERTLELVAEGSNSAGKAQQQFALYSNSLEASANRLTNEWEKFFNSITKGNGLISTFTNSLTGLMKVANSIGPIGTVLGLGSLIKSARQAVTVFDNLNKTIENRKKRAEDYILNKNSINNNQNFNDDQKQEKIGILNEDYYKEQTKDLQNLSKSQLNYITAIEKANSSQKELNATLKYSSDIGGKLGYVIGSAKNGFTKFTASVKLGLNQIKLAAAAMVKQIAIFFAISTAIKLVSSGFDAVKSKLGVNTEAYIENAEKANENASNIKELTTEYETLSKKINLTAEEQSRLAEITKEVSKIDSELGQQLKDNAGNYQENIKLMKEYATLQEKISAQETAKAIKGETKWYNPKNLFQLLSPNTWTNWFGSENDKTQLRNEQENNWRELAQARGTENELTTSQMSMLNKYTSDLIKWQEEQNWDSLKFKFNTDEFDDIIKEFISNIKDLSTKQQEEYTNFLTEINNGSSTYNELMTQWYKLDLPNEVKNNLQESLNDIMASIKNQINNNQYINNKDKAYNNTVKNFTVTDANKIFNPDTSTMSKDEQLAYKKDVAKFINDDKMVKDYVKARTAGTEELAKFAQFLRESGEYTSFFADNIYKAAQALSSESFEKAITNFLKIGNLDIDALRKGTVTQLSILKELGDGILDFNDIIVTAQGTISVSTSKLIAEQEKNIDTIFKALQQKIDDRKAIANSVKNENTNNNLKNTQEVLDKINLARVGKKAISYYGNAEDYGGITGNIDLNDRKKADLGNGVYGTENSITISADLGNDLGEMQYIIPTIINGIQQSEEDAIEYFQQTGEYIAAFTTDTAEETVEAYANAIHERNQEWYKDELSKANNILNNVYGDKYEGGYDSSKTTYQSAVTGAGGFKRVNNVADVSTDSLKRNINNLDNARARQGNKYQVTDDERAIRSEYAKRTVDTGIKDTSQMNQGQKIEYIQKQNEALENAKNKLNDLDKNSQEYYDTTYKIYKVQDDLKNIYSKDETLMKNLNKTSSELDQDAKTTEDSYQQQQKAAENVSEELNKQLNAEEGILQRIKQKLTENLQYQKGFAGFFDGLNMDNTLINSLDAVKEAYSQLDAKIVDTDQLQSTLASNPALIQALDVTANGLTWNKKKLEELGIAAIDESNAYIDSRIETLNATKATLQAESDNIDEWSDNAVEQTAGVISGNDGLIDTQQANAQSEATNLGISEQSWISWSDGVCKAIHAAAENYAQFNKQVANGDTTDSTKTGYSASVQTSAKKGEGSQSEKTIKDKKEDIKNTLKNTKYSSDKQGAIDNINKQIELLQGLKNSNKFKKDNIGSYLGGNLFDHGSGSSKDKFDPVNDELEKFYNYLRKIEKLEAELTQIRSKRSLIDQGKNYYIEDLKQENQLLSEQQKLYRSYINDESSYLQELRNQLQSTYSQWVSFTDQGLIQVKQTEFVANSEAEQEYLEKFMDLQQKYQDEYNTREDNKNKLLEIENTQLENIKTMYEKILARVTDVNEAIQRQIDLLDHDITMSFSNIAKFDIMDDKMVKAVEGIKNSYSYINDFEKQVSELNKQVKNSPFAELLLWDEALETWRVNEEKLNDPAIITKYEKLGYNWQDIDTYVRSVAVKSQSISDSMKETVDSAHEFAETLKGLIDDRISAIQDYYSASTDELNKIFDTFDRKMTDVDNQNNLFGVASASLEDKYLTLVTATAVLKQTIEKLKENKAGILAEIQKEYPEYINMINGVAVVNKQAIEESANLTDKQKAELLQLYGVLEASEEQVKDLEDKLVDYFNTMLEMEQAKRDAIIELKQSVHDELMARDQEEIDNLRSKYDKMSQLDQEYYSELSQRVNDSRNLRENRQQASDIAQMQARLAILKADNSGTYNAELIDLQRQISEQLQVQADNDIDRELERIQREQQQREEDRQLTISAMENVLTFKDDNNWYWQEAQRIWDEGPESVTGFLRSSNEYSNISMEQRALQFEQLTNSMNTAFTTLQTAQGITSAISDGIVSDRSYEEQAKLDNVNSNLSFIQNQINGGEGSLANRIDWSNAKNMEKLDQAILNATNNTGTITTKMQTLYTQNIGPGIKNVKDAITSYLGANSAIWLKINDTKTSLDNTKGDMNSGFDKTVTAAANAATTITNKITEATKEYIDSDTRLYNWLNDKYAKEHAPVTPSNGNGNTVATKPPTKNGSGNSSASNGGNGSGSNTANTRPNLKVGARISVKPGTRWYYDSYGTSPSGTARGGIIRYTNLKGSHPYNIEGLGWIRRQDIVGYSKGGYVDYTGVANVHGTQTEPEAFLNAKQTRLFEGLRDSLVRGANKTYSKEDKEITKEEYNIDNISIEVKQIADVDAIDKVTKRVKEEIYKDAMSNKNNMAVRRR